MSIFLKVIFCCLVWDVLCFLYYIAKGNYPREKEISDDVIDLAATIILLVWASVLVFK